MDRRASRSIHDPEEGYRPVRASIVIGVALLVMGSCTRANEPKIRDRQASRTVALPDLSRLEESVQVQLRERYAALMMKQNDPGTSDDDLAEGYGEMGTLFLAAEILDPAEAALLNAQTLAPRQMRWPYYLGHLYRTKGDIASAATAFERALTLAPNDVATMTWLGEAALDRGRTDIADRFFTKALAIEPRSAAAQYGLGRAQLANRSYAPAAQHLEEALALDGKASVVHYPLAMAYRGLGDARSAEVHLQQRGNQRIRKDPLLKALDDLLHSALTYEKNADEAGSRGEWTAAVDYLKKAVTLAPTRASPHHKLGTALFYLGDRRGAVDEFTEALRLSPSFAVAHYALGVIHLDAREYPQAIASFSAAIRSDPVYVDARVGLADALRRSGQLKASVSEYERILKIDPGSSRAGVGYEAALSELKRIRTESPR